MLAREIYGEKPLNNLSHYPILKNCLDEIKHEGLLIDIGCGAGDVSRCWNSEYLGIDLEWVVEKVSKKCNPNKTYSSIDILNSKKLNIPPSNCVLLNAFLDVVQNPSEILDKILCECKTNWMIIHRQQVSSSKENDFFTYGKSYGDSLIPVSTISLNNLKSIFIKHDAKNVKVFHWNSNYFTILIKL